MKRTDHVFEINANTTDVSRANRLRILDYFRDDAAHTRIEVARALKLSPATVNRLSRHMFDLGLLTPVGEEDTGRGRPAQLIRFDPNALKTLAVSIEPDQIRLASIDLDGNISRQIRVPLDTSRPEGLLPDLENAIDVWVGTYPEQLPLWNIGIAIPGFIDESRTAIFHPLTKWDPLPIEERIQSRFGTRTITENVCNARALAEYHLAGYDHVDSLVMVGVYAHADSAIIIGGDVWRGKDGTAGSFVNSRCPGTDKHLLVPLGAAEIVAEAYNQGILPNPAATIDEFFGLVREDHSGALALLDQVCGTYAFQLANFCGILAPNQVLFDGAFAKWHELVFPRIQTHLAKSETPSIPMGVTTLGSDSDLIGAALNAMRRAGGVGTLL